MRAALVLAFVSLARIAHAQDAAQVSANLDFMPSASGSGHSLTFGVAGNYQRTQPVSRSA